MSPPVPPPTGQSGSDFGPGHRDPDRPSLRLRLAAVLLRQGNTPPDVARTTRVPLALVELINEHLDQPPPTADPPVAADPTTTDPTIADVARPADPRAARTVPTTDQATAGGAREATTGPASTGTGRARRRTLLERRIRWTGHLLRALFLLIAALAATAAVTHDHALAEASLIAIPVTAAVGVGSLWAHHARAKASRGARNAQPDPGQP